MFSSDGDASVLPNSECIFLFCHYAVSCKADGCLEKACFFSPLICFFDEGVLNMSIYAIVGRFLIGLLASVLSEPPLAPRDALLG
jgi:hypothetical protein